MVYLPVFQFTSRRNDDVVGVMAYEREPANSQRDKSGSTRVQKSCIDALISVGKWAQTAKLI